MELGQRLMQDGEKSIAVGLEVTMADGSGHSSIDETLKASDEDEPPDTVDFGVDARRPQFPRCFCEHKRDVTVDGLAQVGRRLIRHVGSTD